MSKYVIKGKAGEGTFSDVLRVQHAADGTFHAMKCLKSKFASLSQVDTLREVQALRRLAPHPHIVALQDIIFEEATGRLALVFELCDANLYEVIRGRRFPLAADAVRSYTHQLLQALQHMHARGIFHRDIKPENVLVEKRTQKIKLADFGSCRGIHSLPPFTEYISTRWYRPPECLLSNGRYGPAMDVWGVGCVVFEMSTLQPLFPGEDEIDQLSRIHKVLGTPPAEMLQAMHRRGEKRGNDGEEEDEEGEEDGMRGRKDTDREEQQRLLAFMPTQQGTGLDALLPSTHASVECLDVLQRMLAYDQLSRLSAKDALRHAFFRGLPPTTMPPMPTPPPSTTTTTMPVTTTSPPSAHLRSPGSTFPSAAASTATSVYEAGGNMQSKKPRPMGLPLVVGTSVSPAAAEAAAEAKRKKVKKACGGVTGARGEHVQLRKSTRHLPPRGPAAKPLSLWRGKPQQG